MKAHHEEIEEEEEEEQKKMEQEKVAAEAIGPGLLLELQSVSALVVTGPAGVIYSSGRQRALKAVCNGRDDPAATATVAFAFFLTGLTVFVYRS